MAEKKKINKAADLAIIYQKFRLVGIELEELVGNIPGASRDAEDFTVDESHRLDKVSVVLKMAFKEIKRILRDNGMTGLKTAAKRDCEVLLVVKGLQGKADDETD